MGGGEKWLRYGLVLCWAVACGGRTSSQGFDDEVGGTTSAGSAGFAGGPGPGSGGASTGVPMPTPVPVPTPVPAGGTGPYPVGGSGPYPVGGASVGGAPVGGSYAVGGSTTMGGFPSGGYAAYPNGGSGFGGNGALGGSGGEWFNESCCETHLAPGCREYTVATCVCAVDDYCCTTMWDLQCVEGVDYNGCGSCL